MMWCMNLRKRFLSLLTCVGLVGSSVVIGAGIASASHFRSSNNELDIASEDGTDTATWTIRTAWRKDSIDGYYDDVIVKEKSDVPNAGDPTDWSLSLSSENEDLSNPLYDVNIQTQDGALSNDEGELAPGQYELYTSSCCRVYGIENAGEYFSDWTSFTKAGDGSFDMPPKFDAVKLYDILPPGGATASFDFTATDPEEGDVTYSLVQGLPEYWDDPFASTDPPCPSGLGAYEDGIWVVNCDAETADDNVVVFYPDGTPNVDFSIDSDVLAAPGSRIVFDPTTGNGYIVNPDTDSITQITDPDTNGSYEVGATISPADIDVLINDYVDPTDLDTDVDYADAINSVAFDPSTGDMGIAFQGPDGGGLIMLEDANDDGTPEHLVRWNFWETFALTDIEFSDSGDLYGVTNRWETCDSPNDDNVHVWDAAWAYGDSSTYDIQSEVDCPVALNLAASDGGSALSVANYGSDSITQYYICGGSGGYNCAGDKVATFEASAPTDVLVTGDGFTGVMYVTELSNNRVVKQDMKWTGSPYYGHNPIPCSDFTDGVLEIGSEFCEEGQDFDEIYYEGSFWAAKVIASDAMGNETTANLLLRVAVGPSIEWESQTGESPFNVEVYSSDADTEQPDHWWFECVDDSSDVVFEDEIEGEGPVTFTVDVAGVSGQVFDCTATASNSAGEGSYDGTLELTADSDGPVDPCERCTGAGGHGGGGGGSTPGTTPDPGSTDAPDTASGGRPLVPGTDQPVAPIPTSGGVLPEVAPGQSLTTEDGVAIPVTITPNASATGFVMTGDGFTFAMEIPASDGEAGSESGVVTLTRNRETVVSGDGFAPGTLVDVWLFSTPTYLGSIRVGADGRFSQALGVPASIPVGPHTLQANGTTADGKTRSLNLGVQVLDRNFTLPKTGGNDTVALVALWLLTAGVFVVTARRRRVIG